MKSCLYCNSTHITTQRNIGGFGIYLCRSCGLLVTDIQDRRLLKKVNEEYYPEAYLAKYLKTGEVLSEIFLAKVQMIDKRKHGGNILDIGCSTGLFLESVQRFSHHKWELYGIDINKNSIEIANKKKIGKMVRSDMKSHPFPKNYFDVITCFDVLEHIPDISQTLSEIKDILKPDGVLFIQLPNSASIMSTLCGNEWDQWAVPDHIYHFTPHTIQKVLNENGFSVITMHSWDPKIMFIQNVHAVMTNKIPKILHLHAVVSAALVPLLHGVFLILKGVEIFYPAGEYLIIVAHKNVRSSFLRNGLSV